MTLEEYQKKAMSTCMPSCRNVSYMLTNLVGEVGELSSKIAKGIRKGQFNISINHLICNVSDPEERTKTASEFDDAVMYELGDILWQLSGLCEVLGFDLDDVARRNLDKLASRKDRGVIDGNGDYR